MKREVLNVGLIGLGSINRAHRRGYMVARDRVRIAAVCDTRVDAARSLAEELGAQAFGDFEEMLAKAPLDAVDITLPHNLHFPVARAALLSGRHVLVEKPMTPVSRECTELIGIARKRGLTFTAAENTPFVRAYQRAEEILKSGALGDLRLVRTFIHGSAVAKLRNRELWKGKLDGSNGGVLIDSGPHSVYLIKWLFGAIRELQARQHKLVEESEVEDNAVMTGRLENGALFSSEYSFTAELPWGERLEVYGSEGSLLVDQLLDPPLRLYRGKDDVEGVAVDGVKHDLVDWKYDSIARGVEDFISAVTDGRAPRVDPEDARYGVYIAEKAYESVRSGGIKILV